MTEIELTTIGKYQILGKLGKGAMGVVYKARDPEIGRLVAIKTLRKFDLSKAGGHETAIERFRQEARSAGILRHPNIVTIFEVNCHGNLPYLVMDYVDGHGLDALIAKYNKMNPGLALTYLSQIASALDYAHGKGVIHRDVKPSNIVVDTSDNVFVLDFGVASMSRSYQDWESPRESVVMGTPSYMSPEQIGNQRLDRRSDIFSLTVVAFEMLTGKRPFTGNDFQTVSSNILNGRPLSLTALVPELPLALEAELERGFAKNRDHRFGSAQEMVRAFGKAVGVELPGSVSLSLSGQFIRDSSAQKFDSARMDAGQIGSGSSPFSSAGNQASREAAEGISLEPKSGAASSNAGNASSDAVGSTVIPAGGGSAGGPSPWEHVAGAVSTRGAGARSSDPFAINEPARPYRSSAGELFAHVSGSLTEEAARNPVFIESKPSTFRYFAAVVILGTIGLIGYLGWLIVLTPGKDSTPPLLLAGANSPQDIPRVVPQVSLIEEDGLVDPVGETPPADTSVGEMTERQLIGTLKNRDLPEVVIMGALREAKSRRIAGLVDVSIYPLQSDSYAVRVETIKILAEIGDKRIVPHLMLTLDDHDPLVRGHAARALGLLGDRRAIAYLTARGMKEDVPEVKAAIARSIERITGMPARLD